MIKVYEEPIPTITFPKLMIAPSTGIIVLFIKEGEGVVVKSTNPNIGLGLYSDSWRTDEFDNYHGTLVLKNEGEKSDYEWTADKTRRD